MVQTRIEDPHKLAEKILTVGGLGFSIFVVVFKIIEFTSKAFSNLLGSNLVWFSLILLIGAGIITTLNIIYNKDTTKAKYVGGVGGAFSLMTLICLLSFVYLVPQEYQTIITSL